MTTTHVNAYHVHISVTKADMAESEKSLLYR